MGSRHETEKGAMEPTFTVEHSDAIGNPPRQQAPSRQLSEKERWASSTAEHGIEQDPWSISPENPFNWEKSKRWRITMVLALTGFISVVGSTIAAPGIEATMETFGEHRHKVGVLVQSCYVFGFGAGPFLFAPLSELFGRQVSYHVGQVGYLFFCLATALAPNMVGLIILRLLCGVVGSVGPGLGMATCADMWATHERGLPVAVYAAAVFSGPVFGGMLGFWILFGGWRWLYWAVTIMVGLNYLLLVFFTQETYAPVIRKRLHYEICNPLSPEDIVLPRWHPRRLAHRFGWVSQIVTGNDAAAVFGRAFSRPPRLLFTNPIAAFWCLYYAFQYALIYVVLIMVPLLFGSPPFSRPGLFSYHFPQSTLSLAYLAAGVGAVLALIVAANSQDRIYRRMSRLAGDNGQPEYRLPLTQAGMLLIPAGLFLLGWSAQYQTHWMGPLVGYAILAIGQSFSFQTIQNYLVDGFAPYSAAAVAASTAARSVVACILPIFVPDLVGNLGWGWGCSLLGFVSLAAAPVPFVMIKYGKGLRERFKFEG